MNIRIKRIDLENAGHVSKFVVEYPVVVIIEPTWNRESLSDISNPEYRTLIRFTVIRTTDTAITPR
jgi:hypothetical protein